jgi:hypothetical protein
MRMNDIEAFLGDPSGQANHAGEVLAPRAGTVDDQDLDLMA